MRDLVLLHSALAPSDHFFWEYPQIDLGQTQIHLTAYYQKAARDIVDMEAYPELTPRNCTTIIPLCDQSEERRIQTIGLLRRFGLNVFSARFRRIHASVIHLHE